MINNRDDGASEITLGSTGFAMSRSIFITLVVYSLSSLAHAADSWYIGGAIGKVSGSLSATDLSNDLSTNGVTVSDIRIDDSRTGWKLTLGIEITETLAFEVGYLNLNDVSVELSAEVADPDSFIAQAINIHPRSADGFTLGGVYRFDLNDKYDLFLRAGLFSWSGDFNTFSLDSGEQIGSEEINSTDIYYGLGGGYKMTDKLTFILEWEHFKLDSESSQMWSIGARYRL